MKAEDFMSSDLIWVGPQDSMSRAAQLMWDNDIGFLPVLGEAGKLLGVVTDRDLCMAAFTRGLRMDDANVESAMSREVHTLPPQASLTQLEALMRACKIRRVPIVDDYGTVVGIVSVGDLACQAVAQGVLGALSLPGIIKTVAIVGSSTTELPFKSNHVVPDSSEATRHVPAA